MTFGKNHKCYINKTSISLTLSLYLFGSNRIILISLSLSYALVIVSLMLSWGCASISNAILLSPIVTNKGRPSISSEPHRMRNDCPDLRLSCSGAEGADGTDAPPLPLVSQLKLRMIAAIPEPYH